MVRQAFEGVAIWAGNMLVPLAYLKPASLCDNDITSVWSALAIAHCSACER